MSEYDTLHRRFNRFVVLSTTAATVAACGYGGLKGTQVGIREMQKSWEQMQLSLGFADDEYNSRSISVGTSALDCFARYDTRGLVNIDPRDGDRSAREVRYVPEQDADYTQIQSCIENEAAVTDIFLIPVTDAELSAGK